MDKMSTQERIIHAAIDLVREKGYKGATTKLIAEQAGVNEVTVFRHFGNKKGIVEAAISKYSFVDIISETLHREVVWDINKDLKMIATLFQNQFNKKRDIILISFKESGVFPELDKMISQVPMEYKRILMDYFTRMIQKGKMRNVDVDVVTTNFFLMNFGYFLLKSRLQPDGENIPLEAFLNHNIAFFIENIVQN